MQAIQPGTVDQTGRLQIADAAPDAAADPWLAEAREQIEQPGQYLAYDESDAPVVHELSGEWTRIGRSLAADVRFDDSTVSRRHALLVRGADGIRVMDDRSLNGVYVNGERVEWRVLADGDQVIIGRHRLYFVDLSGELQSPVGAASASGAGE